MVNDQWTRANVMADAAPRATSSDREAFRRGELRFAIVRAPTAYLTLSCTQRRDPSLVAIEGTHTYMQVLTNTDRNIAGSEALSALVEASVTETLGRFLEQVTRVEVHLSDENSKKGGADDKRCLMEARLEGRPPTAVSHRASTMQLAIQGAAGKLARAIESTIGRLQSSRGRRPPRLLAP